MKRTAPFWESPLDWIKLLLTGLGLALLLGMLRGCLPGGPSADMPDVDLPGAELGIEAPGLDLPSIPEADLPALAEGGYELTGVAMPGSEVELFDGDLSLGSVTAGPDGKWAFALPALAAGAHALRALGPDMDGNPFEINLPSFDLPELSMPEVDLPSGDAPGLDLAMPAFDLPDLGEMFMAGDLPTLSGTAEPGSFVQLYDGDVLLGEVVADADGNWSFDLPELLGAGEHSLRAVTFDIESNEQASEIWTFTVEADAAMDADADDGDAAAEGGDDAAAPADEEEEEGENAMPAALPKTGRAPVTP